MSRFLCSLAYLILFINCLDTVRILGIFPAHQNKSLGYVKSNPSRDWITQSIAMFRAAFVLANRYGINVDGYPINHTILQITADGTGLTEFEFVCRSITNTIEPDILGIVGPTSSTNIRFLGPFAAHTGLPLVSYAATHAALNDISAYETFYRTVPSDVLLAEAIVQLFKYFSWTTCIIIIGKGDDGYGGLEILSDIYSVNLTIQERLIFDPLSDKFHANLKQTLGKSHSRIVLVWANQSSSTRIIQHALTEKLLGQSYIWLTTNKIDFDVFEPSKWSMLEGILTVAPFISNQSSFGVNETLQKEAFNVWRNSLDDNEFFTEDLSAISPFAMYTFDAAWILIQALNKSSFDHTSPSMEESVHCFDSSMKNHNKYHMHLKNTSFSGVSGFVKFKKNKSNDRINGSFYGLYNVQWIRQKDRIIKEEPIYEHVLTWYESSHSWNNCTDDIKIDIVWPSDTSNKVPTDYPELEGQFLRILVIEAQPFVIVRNISTKNDVFGNKDKSVERVNFNSNFLKTKDPTIIICGFIVDLILELERRMHFNYTIDVADPKTNYHSLVALIASDNRQYDIILSDVRVTSSRLLTVDFSTSYYENTLRIITRQNPYSSSVSLSSYFNPFTWDVWVAILAAIIYSGIIIYLFERQNIKIDKNKCKAQAICIGICQALSSIIIMTGDVRLTTNSSRLTVLALYALGIILIATYTANLSSFLTLNRAQPPISGIDDIKNGRLPFTRIGVVTNSAVLDYYIQNISSNYHCLYTTEEIYLRLLDNTIDAAIWESSVLEYAVNNYYCNELTVVGVGFVKSSFAAVLPKNWLYKKDLDVHLLSMRESEKFDALEHTWFGNHHCQSSSRSMNGIGDSNMTTFSLDVLSGLFLIFLILTIIAFGFHLCILLFLTVGIVYIQGNSSESSDSNDNTGNICGRHKRYNPCGSACPLTCDDLYYPQETKVCAAQCVAGCFCKDGYYLKDGKCFKPKECCSGPYEFYNRKCGSACSKNCLDKEEKPCTTQCVQGCFCQSGYIRENRTPNSTCIDQNKCPK